MSDKLLAASTILSQAREAASQPELGQWMRLGRNDMGPRRFAAALVAVIFVATIGYGLFRASLFFWAAGFR